MKIYITILFVCSALFINCSKDENVSEISINRNDETRQKKNSSDTGAGINKSSGKISPSQVISSKEVKTHVGDSLTIKGYIADIYLSDKVAYLNFENRFPKNTFSCAIFSSVFDEFGDLSRFKNKTVEVTGKIMTYKGKPQVILNSKDQIKIISDE